MSDGRVPLAEDHRDGTHARLADSPVMRTDPARSDDQERAATVRVPGCPGAHDEPPSQLVASLG